MQTITYRFQDMPEPLLDFALSLEEDFALDLFDGGLIARYVGEEIRCSDSALALVVTINPEFVVSSEPETATMTQDERDALYVAVERTISEASSQAYLRADLVAPDLAAEWIEGESINSLWPDLEVHAVFRTTEVEA